MTTCCKSLLLAAFCGAAASAQAQVFEFTGWDFNTPDNDDSTGTLLPSVGTGSVAAVGSTQFLFGHATSSSEGPAANNSALHIVAPAGAAAGDQIGVTFSISAAGYSDISLFFDALLPAGSPNTFSVEYSLNSGGSWTEYGTFSATESFWGTPNTGNWANAHLVDFTGTPAADNNAGIQLRIVTTLSGAIVSPETLLELDRVYGSVDITPVPEPAETAAAFGAAALAAAVWLRRRR